MPIFRIMGGGQTSRASTYPGNRAAASSSNGEPNNSRSTYPGMRAPGGPPQPTAAPTRPPTSMPTAAGLPHPMSTTISTSSVSTNNYNSSAPPPTASADSNVILRGSNVAPPQPAAAAGPTLPNLAGHVAPPSAAVAARGPETTRPGAYAVTRTATGPAQVYRVTVPAGVSPGSEFTVHAGPRRVRVRCPNTSRPGQSLQITLPPEPVTHNTPLRMAPLTAAFGQGGGGAVQMSQEVRNVNKAASDSGGTAQTFLVTIPPNIYPGMQFTVDVGGQRFVVTCPPNAGPDMKVRIVPPTQREEPMAAPKTQVFEVAVPPGVGPNEPFALVANGQRVLVTCPPNVSSGRRSDSNCPSRNC